MSIDIFSINRDLDLNNNIKYSPKSIPDNADLDIMNITKKLVIGNITNKQNKKKSSVYFQESILDIQL